ncbi:hypothetical protein KNN17_21740 [Arthrobacter bambusae]|uniref:hypothetical protein n=1 Tax=Arthrobacter bambusae TaxID=1338426 RepID=UPI001F50B48B|nr:hypothetical protein [Arthrobacter bambusae]MCI0144174.1 hypothetical protein [Arthrobacter bambusae]
MEGNFAFEADEQVRLVVPFSTGEGSVYKVGMTGTICPLHVSFSECQRSDSYELNLYDASTGIGGLVMSQSAYFERTSERKPGELRQGDRVKLSDDFLDDEESVDTGTVICTHVKPDGILHDIALDFSGSVRIPHEGVEQIPDEYAKVEFSPDGALSIDLFPEDES